MDCLIHEWDGSKCTICGELRGELDVEIDNRIKKINDRSFPYNERCKYLSEMLLAFDKSVPSGQLTVFADKIRHGVETGKVKYKRFKVALDTLVDDADNVPENICCIAENLPSRFASMYGFKFRYEEYESEDQFGRYTSGNRYVTYKEKEYKMY